MSKAKERIGLFVQEVSCLMVIDKRPAVSYVIENQAEATSDIGKIAERFYDLGKVSKVERLTMGDSNFNYFIVFNKDGVETKYFGQLFSSSSEYENVLFEMELRAYYVKHNRSRMMCAEPRRTIDGQYMVACYCPEISKNRYFCVFDFLKGNAQEREDWAYGQIPKELITGCARGIARLHAGAYGFKASEQARSLVADYEAELADYRKKFTEDFEAFSKDSDYEYYGYFHEYQPRLLEILDRNTEEYLEHRQELPTCICHVDTSPQNYLFSDDMDPIGICDLNLSQEFPRLVDLGWFINEGLCKYDPEAVTNSLDVDDITLFIDAYDEEIERLDHPVLGKLTKTERKMLMKVFELTSIKCGFAYIWDYIVNDTPTNTYEFNVYWGNWTKSIIEFVEEHIDEFDQKIAGSNC